MKIKSELVIDLAACFLVFILMFVVLGVLTNVNTDVGNSSTQYTLVDYFTCPTDDQNGTDPNGNDTDGVPYSTFYDYDEEAWGRVDDINDSEGYTVDGTLWNLGNDSGAESDFVFLDHNGDEFCSDYGIERIAWDFKIDNKTHTGVDYTLYDCNSGVIVWLSVYKTNVTLYTTGPTKLWNRTIVNDTWYRFEMEIDYNTGPFTYTSTLWGLDLPGLFTVELETDTTAIETTKLWMLVEDPTRAGYWGDIYTDGLQIEYTVDSTTTSALNDLPGMWVVMVGILVLAIIIAVLFLVISEMKGKKKGR